MPAFLTQFGYQTLVFIQDHNAIKDMFVTKNSITDKHGFEMDLLFPLLGDSMLFSKSDALWKLKRKVCGEAFYKERLTQMAETFKQVCNSKIDEIKSEIPHSQDGTARLHFARTIQSIYVTTIFMVLFGEDIS